jgi:NADP-dependent 3-hydroxy acid dehydrogenase YdfG
VTPVPALSGRVAIVTGASSGIGEATARLLAREGAAVALAARRTDRLERLKAEIEADGGRALVVETDVARQVECDCLVRRTLVAFGRLDVLVNNAGVMPLSLVKNVRVDEWERMVDVNVKGVLFCTAAALPAMLEQGSGHVVNVSSTAGRRVFEGGAVYCATKHAVTAFSEGLRMELSPYHQIRVTCIEPGAVATELGQAIRDEEFKAKSDASGAWDGVRVLQPEDVASAILYAVAAPPHTNVHEVLVMPTDQRVA